MKRWLMLLLLALGCVSSEPVVTCSPPPMTVSFENRQAYGIAVLYGGRVRSLRPRDGRVEVTYSGSTYRIENEWRQLTFGVYDQFGTLHVDVR